MAKGFQAKCIGGHLYLDLGGGIYARKVDGIIELVTEKLTAKMFLTDRQVKELFDITRELL